LTQFFAGPENALAATGIAPFLDRSTAIYSPLALYGPPGSGKSHLARGLADWWREKFPAAAVECLSGREFVEAHTEKRGSPVLETWRERLRSSALFVLDDLDELADKLPAQQELAYVVDALADRGSLVVVTAAELPARRCGFSPALRGRLSAGLAVALAPPGKAARRAILAGLSATRGISLSGEALDALAEGLQGSVPALVSALVELELLASVGCERLDRERIRDFVARRVPGPRTLREIANLTARYFGLKVADLKSPARRRTLVAGRGVAMYLAREVTASSLAQIGSFFGGRDHATVLYGCRRTEKLLRRDRAIREAVAELRKLLASP
jgi:chromosomal replication initiator protein